MGNESDLLPLRTTPKERQVAKTATATPKEFGGTGDPDLDEYLNYHVGSAGVTHRNGTFVSGPGKHMTPGQYREKKLADWKRGDRSTAEQGAMSSMAENFAALKRRQVQRPQVQSPAAPAAPAVPPSPALPAASAVANNMQAKFTGGPMGVAMHAANTAAAAVPPIQSPAAPTSTAPRPPGIRDDGEVAIQKFLRNEVANMNPDNRPGAKVGWADDGRNGQKLVSVPSGERSGMAHLDALGGFQRKQQQDRADAYAGTLQRGQKPSAEGFAAWSKANPVNYDMQARAAQAHADAATAPRAVTSRAPADPSDVLANATPVSAVPSSSLAKAGIYDNGKRVMSPATTGPSASVTMPNGKVESTDFKLGPFEPSNVIKARAEFAAAHEGPSGSASAKQDAAGMAKFKAKQKALARAMNPALVNAQDELERARYAGSGRPADFKRFKTAQAKVAAMNPAEPAPTEPELDAASLTAR